VGAASRSPTNNHYHDDAPDHDDYDYDYAPNNYDYDHTADDYDYDYAPKNYDYDHTADDYDYDYAPKNYDYDHTADDYDYAPKNYDHTADDDGATALVSAVPPCPCSPHAKDRNTPREAELRAWGRGPRRMLVRGRPR
jgi:hypothetical protein